MKTETIIVFGMGALVGGLLAAKILSQPETVEEIMTVTDSRWTSGYHGPAYGVYPEAGIAEKLYPYGEMHKMTGLTPYATTMGITGATTNGNIIYID
ncbi:MAG: hypothetical protein ACTSUF_03720 [Candidatus Heimdallarchaeaceae archaeon]